MKKIYTILMSLMLLTLVQCKPTPIDDDNTPKVKVSCELPINGGSKTDFSNIASDGSMAIYWSDGDEYIYLAVPHSTQSQIIELKGNSNGNESILTFNGEMSKDLLTDDAEYEIWYLGNSMSTSTSYVNKTMSDGIVKEVSGSIGKQNGNISNLGLYHIAKITVNAVVDEDRVLLIPSGKFTSQMAIAYLDMEGVKMLNGDAIVGTDYALKYNSSTNKFDFVVTENADATINTQGAGKNACIVLLPNGDKNTVLRGIKDNGAIFGIDFGNEIKANKLYYKKGAGGQGAETLPWYKISDGAEGQYEYVDLGLPSGVKWARMNIGATSPEGHGDFYAWAEIETKKQYIESTYNYTDVNIGDFSGNATYDVATAKWGGRWRMPTDAEMRELINNCNFEYTALNGVKGFMLTSKINGNTIFFPAAGWKKESGGGAGSNAYYWGSTQASDAYARVMIMNLNNTGTKTVSNINRTWGHSVRAVVGDYLQSTPIVTTNEVSDITSNSAVCGGNVRTDGYSEVVQRGVCWNTKGNPTINNSHTVDGGGTGPFTSNITNLLPNTTYYVRAYAINSKGTVYGEQKTIVTLASTGTINGHDWVDLGLSVKWATCNVGATSPEGYGNYYAWGNTTPATNDVYTIGNSSTYGKQVSDISGNAQYDAARYNWGGTWRMPTASEYTELYSCTWQWTTQNGVNGYKIIGSNGNHIFMPAAGYRYSFNANYVGSEGWYWTSMPAYDNNNANGMKFDSGSKTVLVTGRECGLTIRPVTE